MIDLRHHDFGALRQFIHLPRPGPKRWQALCRALESWPRHELVSQVLPYLEHHLGSWPDGLRRAPRPWLEAALRGQAPVALRLVRHLNLQAWTDARPRQLPAHKRRSPSMYRQEHRTLSPAGRAVLRLSELRGIRTLNLAGMRHDRALIDDLMAAPGLTDLRQLNLTGTGITVRRLRFLGQAPFAPTLEVLQLNGNKLYSGAMYVYPEDYSGSWRDTPVVAPDRSGSAARALCSGAWRGLRRLELTGCQLTREDLETMATWPTLARLERLHLGNLVVAPGDYAILLRASLLPALRHLVLGGRCFGAQASTPDERHDDIMRILDGGLFPQLTTLNMQGASWWASTPVTWYSDIRQPTLEALVKCLTQPRSLALGGDFQLSAPGLRALAQAEAMRHIEHLNISWRWLGGRFREAVPDLVTHPHFANVRRFEVVILDEASLLALARSPHTTNLRELVTWGAVQASPETARAVLASPYLHPRVKGPFRKVASGRAETTRGSWDEEESRYVMP